MDYFRLQGRADVLFNIFQSDAPAVIYHRIARDMRHFLRPVLHDDRVSVSRKAKLLFLSFAPRTYRMLQRVSGGRP